MGHARNTTPARPGRADRQRLALPGPWFWRFAVTAPAVIAPCPTFACDDESLTLVPVLGDWAARPANSGASSDTQSRASGSLTRSRAPGSVLRRGRGLCAGTQGTDSVPTQREHTRGVPSWSSPGRRSTRLRPDAQADRPCDPAVARARRHGADRRHGHLHREARADALARTPAGGVRAHGSARQRSESATRRAKLSARAASRRSPSASRVAS